jgi:hypothetical protein
LRQIINLPELCVKRKTTAKSFTFYALRFMKERTKDMKKTALKFILLALCILGITAYANVSQAQTNLLTNPSFEWPYGSNGEANAWGRWHENSAESQFGDCLNGYHKLPHWSAETNPALVRNGGVSQHVGMQWETWHAGVFQTVNVTPGSTYRFSVWAYAHAGMNNIGSPSDGDMNSQVQVGIDPNGSGLWYDSDVVWSGKINPLDRWEQVSVEVTATGDKVSVYTSANYGIRGANQCRAHLDAWFDQAELIEIGPPPTNTPVPQPTSPPPPPVTNTSVPVLVPTATTEPTQEVASVPTAEPPTPTPEPPAGGTICVNAFADANANGVKDADEGYMGSVTFTIAQGTTVIGQAVSTGTPTPVCFEGLAAGEYQVAQTVPAVLQMTTAGNASLAVAEGQVVGIEFGSRVRTEDQIAEAGGETDGLTPTPGSGVDSGAIEEGSGSSRLLAFGGIFLLFGGLLLLGGIVIVVLGRRGGA